MGQREEIIAREELLKKIRQALIVSKDNPFEDEDLNVDVYNKNEEIPELIFAQELMAAGGKFVFCENTGDFHAQFQALASQKNWNRFRAGCDQVAQFLALTDDVMVPDEQSTGEEISLTRCEYLAARTGSVIMSTSVCPDPHAWSFCSVHVVIASTDQVVDNLSKAYSKLKEKYRENYPSVVSVITGPSRTADIEKQLVMGAHGPVELYVFLIDVES
jgi:L-lactate dehydrogenase complex protein LldG